MRGDIPLRKPDKPVIPCLCCGICCSKFQVRVSLEEAHLITNNLGISWRKWLGEYADPRWPGTRSMLIRHRDGACIFLKRLANNRTACIIHTFKPSSCRDWTASLTNSECQEGLFKNWGLTIDSAGIVSGSQENIERFNSYLKSLLTENHKS